MSPSRPYSDFWNCLALNICRANSQISQLGCSLLVFNLQENYFSKDNLVSIGKITVSFTFEYCMNNTADGTHVSSACTQNYHYVIGIRPAQQRQAFSLNTNLDMHSYPIEKQTSIGFTQSSEKNELLELSK